MCLSGMVLAAAAFADILSPYGRSLYFFGVWAYCLLPLGAALIALSGAVGKGVPRPQSPTAGPISAFCAPFSAPLYACPFGGALAALSWFGPLRWLMRPRLEVSEQGVSVVTRFRRRFFAASSIQSVDWHATGILLVLVNGQEIRVETTKQVRAWGPADHFPSLRHAVRASAVAMMHHNETLARAIRAATRPEACPYRARL